MIFFSIMWISVCLHVCKGSGAYPKIAIIGGGIGGTSCAYFLRQLFAENATVTLFEKDTIGGRLDTLGIGVDEFESGGSVIHPKNKYMEDFSKMLDLDRRKSRFGLWGIYDGQEFLFQTSPWTLVTMAKLYWRYGWNVFQLDALLQSLLNDFGKIYKAQDKGKAFTNVYKLLAFMNKDFPSMTQQTLAYYLKVNGFSERFIKELAQAIMLVNYGQTTDINAFGGSVSLAGSETGLWCIKGGNRQVPVGLLDRSKAKLVQAEVTSVLLQTDGSFQLTFKTKSSNTIIIENFDVVVIANPLMKEVENIKFLNFTKDMTKYEGLYHRTISTFVKGRVDDLQFQTSKAPDVILTNNDSYAFNSLAVSYPVSDHDIPGPYKVYKVFSKVPLSDTQLNEWFKEIENTNTKDWLAYPHYTVPEKIPPFVLHPGLYYLNAIERSASAMEMSAVSARNVALLIFNAWTGRTYFIDAHDESFKDEL